MGRRQWWWAWMAIALGVVLGWHALTPADSTAAWLSPAPPQWVAQAEDTAPATSAFPLAGTYTDETGEQYQIGIAEGFQLDSAQGNPIFSAPDGSLAYSLVTVPLSNEAPLADVALAAVVQDTFGNGEGFQTQGFQATNQGLQVAWTGLFSQGSQPPVAMAGTVVAQQRGTTVYLLMVAAQPAAQAQVPEVVGALLDSLQIQ